MAGRGTHTVPAPPGAVQWTRQRSEITVWQWNPANNHGLSSALLTLPCSGRISRVGSLKDEVYLHHQALQLHL